MGQLYVEGDLRVIGTVEGGLEVTGSVEIDGGGRVTGPVTAQDRLVVGRSGSLLGDVRVARLVIQDGATFSGNVSMGPAVDVAPKLQPPVPPESAPQAPIAAAPEPPPAMPQSGARPAAPGKSKPPVVTAPKGKPKR